MLGKEKVNLNLLLACCSRHNTYDYQDTGKAAKMMFNTIVLTSYFDF